MVANQFDFKQFDQQWTTIGKEICQELYIDPRIQRIKREMQKHNSLNDEQINEFIKVCNATKYKVIYEKFGQEGTPGYEIFNRNWQAWFKEKNLKGGHVDSQQKSSVEHILIGSTPDPMLFLLHFEEEMLGSMKKN